MGRSIHNADIGKALVPSWLVSDHFGGEDAGCGGSRLVWLHVVATSGPLCFVIKLHILEQPFIVGSSNHTV